MNLTPEKNAIRFLNLTEKRKPVTVTMPQAVLERIDAAAGKLKMSRGDFLMAAFLRLESSYMTTEEKAALLQKNRARIERLISGTV